MSKIMLASIRILAVLLGVAMLGQFLQPANRAAAAAPDTYSLVKTVSLAPSCTGPAPLGPGTASVTVLTVGQCVAVHLAITNASTSPDPISTLTLSDPLTGGLTGVANSCSYPTTTGYTCTVTSTNFTFASTATYSGIAPGTTGVEDFLVQVPCGTAPIINTAFADARNSAGLSFTGNAANATITPAACPAPTSTTLTLTKTVDSLPCPASMGCNARRGTTLTYRLNYANTGATSANPVTITDTLSAGQSFIDVSPASPMCVPANAGAGVTTVTCNVGIVPAAGLAGSTGSIVIHAQVNGVQSPVTNSATIAASNVNGGVAAASNTTSVIVTDPIPTPVPCGTFCNPCGTACGTCGTTCGACGTTCGTCGTTCGTCGTTCGTCGTTCGTCGTTCGTCGTTCGTCGTTCGTCGTFCGTCGTTACGTCGATCGTCGTTCGTCGATCGFFGTRVVCGVVTGFNPQTASTAGAVTLNNAQTFTVAAGTTFAIPIFVGGNFCFVFNASSFVTGCLSGIPTGLAGPGAARRGSMYAD